MNKFNSYFPFLLLLPCLCGVQCKKDTAVSNSPNTGYVKEYYTNKPIANAEVGVYSDNNYTKLVENVYTDSNGKFVTNENISGYANILVSKQGYFQYTWSNWQTNRNNNMFYLDMPAYIQTHIKNVNPVNSSDQIDVEGFPDNIGYLGTVTLIGSKVDTTICCILALGYKPYKIPVFVYKYPKAPTDSAMPVTCTPIGNQTIT
ncbi:MAG: hypothetical protein ACHQK8_08260, partial [Bacteroidia bacterium]